MKSLYRLQPVKAVVFISLPFVLFLGALVYVLGLDLPAEMVKKLSVTLIMAAFFPVLAYSYRLSLESYLICRQKGYHFGHSGIIRYGMMYTMAYIMAVVVLSLYGLDLRAEENRFFSLIFQLPAALWVVYIFSLNAKTLISLEKNEETDQTGGLIIAFILFPFTAYFIQKRLFKAGESLFES